MRKTRYGAGLVLLVIWVVIWLTGCTGIQVSQDYDTEADFSRLGTFSWADETQPETDDPRIQNPLQHARIQSAVERVLASRGFSKVIPVQHVRASFQVRYHYTLRPRVDAGSGIDVGIGIGGLGRRTGGGISVGTGNSIDTYDQVELVVDILDGTTGALLWRGIGTCRFVEYQNPLDADAAIDRLVTTLMRPFPPKISG